MIPVHFESAHDDSERRGNIYRGHIYVFQPRPSTTALCAFARELAEEAFAPRDPQRAQFDLPVEEYARLLRQSFNQGTVPGLMCRSMVSVRWDGWIYDCDFNQMLRLPLTSGGSASSIWELSSLDQLVGGQIATGDHCFGCTAGAGSSCTGALD